MKRIKKRRVEVMFRGACKYVGKAILEIPTNLPARDIEKYIKQNVLMLGEPVADLTTEQIEFPSEVFITDAGIN